MKTRKNVQPAPMPAAELDAAVARLAALGVDQLRTAWRKVFGASAPASLSKDLIARTLTHRLQAEVLGGLHPRTLRILRDLAKAGSTPPRRVKVGSVIVREHGGVLHEVLVAPEGFCWQGRTYDSLSTIAKVITGTTWNGPRFFGLRDKRGPPPDAATMAPADSAGGIRAGRRSSIGGAIEAAHSNASGPDGDAGSVT